MNPNYKDIFKLFLTTLNSFEYALLNPEAAKNPVNNVKIALRLEDKEAFFEELKTKFDFETTANKLSFTGLKILSERDPLHVKLFHFFHFGRLTYMDINQVLHDRRMSHQGFYAPSMEHSVEFRILDSFLNGNAIDERLAKWFSTLDIFLQEGLLEYFNKKYDTLFNSPDELTEYRETIKNHLKKQLRQLPENKFSNRLKLEWQGLKKAVMVSFS